MFNLTFFIHLISTLSNNRYTAGTDPFFQRFTSVTTPQHYMMSSVPMSPNTSVCTMVCLISSQLFLTHQHFNAFSSDFFTLYLYPIFWLYTRLAIFEGGKKKCRFVNPYLLYKRGSRKCLKGELRDIYVLPGEGVRGTLQVILLFKFLKLEFSMGFQTLKSLWVRANRSASHSAFLQKMIEIKLCY